VAYKSTILKNRLNRRSKFLSPDPPLRIRRGNHVEPSKIMKEFYQPPYWWEAQAKRNKLERKILNKELSKRLENKSPVRQNSYTDMSPTVTYRPPWETRIWETSGTRTIHIGTYRSTTTYTTNETYATPMYINISVSYASTF